jgi:hypothetical protein
MGTFVMNPIEAGAVGQGAETTVTTAVNWPQGQVNGATFEVERILTVCIGLVEIVFQQRVIGIRDPQTKCSVPFGQHQSAQT